MEQNVSREEFLKTIESFKDMHISWLRKREEPTESLWSKKRLPTYEKVKQWFLRNEHTSHFYSSFHDRHIFQFWNKEYIAGLAEEIQSLVGKDLVLEVCAGDGCLTHWLKEYGVNVVATDDYSWGKIKHVFPVEKFEALEAIDHYKPKLVIASWIPYGSQVDLQMIQKNMPYYVFIGESDGGCTGSEEFWEKYKDYASELKDLGKCDKWNICRTDYSWGDNEFQHHSWTLFLKSK